MSERRPIARSPRYLIDEDGHVFSTIGGTTKEIVPSNSGRYLHVTLGMGVGVKRQTVDVHVLVAETFIGPCPPGEEVRHLDGDQRHNHWSNLGYATHEVNISDKNAHGTGTVGEHHPGAKLTAKQVEDIRSRDCSGRGAQRALAREFGVAASVICRIRKGQLWTKARPSKGGRA